MQNINSKNIISLIIASLSLGWIIGNSTSPVIATVVSSLIAISITILTTLIGIELRENLKFSDVKLNLLPFGIFCSCLAFGGSLGIYSREHRWLGDKLSITQKTKNLVKPEEESSKGDDIGFKNNETEFCAEIRAHYTKPKIVKELLMEKSKNDERISRVFLNSISDSVTIVKYAKSVCENEN